MPQILYSSAAVHGAISQLFKAPTSSDRRVALVAYVGSGALRYSHQAIQVFRLADCPRVPFQLTPRFKSAFRAAAIRYGIKALTAIDSLKPPKRLLDDIAETLAAGDEN